jgi:glutathione S-transferase
MKLYWHPVSLMPWRVRIALAEKGLACDEEIIDLPGGASRRPAFLALNPFGQVPVLEDDGTVIAESTAILEYLEELKPDPALMPARPAARATVRQLMGWSNDIWPFSWKRWIAPHSLGIPPGPEVAAQGRAELTAHLDVLDRRLAGADWLVGDYSLADICYAPLVAMAARAGLDSEITGRPGVAAWVERLAARPAVQAGMGMLLG